MRERRQCLCWAGVVLGLIVALSGCTYAAISKLSLDELDREAVLGGVPRVGISAEALLFLWGSPYYTAGDAQRYAHWYYLGSSLVLGESGNRYRQSSNRVDVYLVDGHVVGWVDYSPSEPRNS